MAAPAAQYADSRPLLHGLLPDAGSRLWNAALTEIRGRLAQRRIIVGHARVWWFFAREKISFKKKPHTAEQDDETLDNVEQSPTL